MTLRAEDPAADGAEPGDTETDGEGDALTAGGPDVDGDALAAGGPDVDGAAAAVPEWWVVQDGSEAATALPAPRTTIPPASTAATSFGLIMCVPHVGLRQ